MCGIVGILGNRPVAPLLIDALKRLEYRGYDSAGIATLENKELKRVRSAGKLVNLEEKVKNTPLKGHIGLGHTRWATHGAPIELNAHPHMNETVAVVHNGIIENFASLKEDLKNMGYEFITQTDTEVLVYLLTEAFKKTKNPQKALQETLKKIHGAFALGILFQGEEDLLLAARQGAPLAIGYGDDEIYIGSDAIALSALTDKITYLEDGDWAVLTKDNVKIYNENDKLVSRAVVSSGMNAQFISKGEYRHFMQKEIYEQPRVVTNTLSHYLDFQKFKIKETACSLPWEKISQIRFSACGTAYYATLVAKYFFESLANINVDNDVASEFRYRNISFSPDSLAFFVSQSGETADSLAALRYCKEKEIPTAVIVNVPQSTISREADYVFPTLSGPEIGVASTKAFTCQLATLCSLALAAAKAKNLLDDEKEKKFIKEFSEISNYIHQALKQEKNILEICREFLHVKNILYLGRGLSYPIALEGALKLKELSYIHAEGYAAGELKHGPIALIDEFMPVIVISPYDRWFEKTISNIQEVVARGGEVILITDERGHKETKMNFKYNIVLPDLPEYIAPIIYSIPVQLLAYHMAVLLGTDVDQPRNLAKSVTVE